MAASVLHDWKIGYMKIYFTFLLVLFLGLAGCRKEDTQDNNTVTKTAKKAPDWKADHAKLAELLRQFEEPSQKFNVPSGKVTKVTGKKGTVISINPDNLMTENGQPLGKEIEVELKELTDTEALLRANASTTSDGRLLVSGGAYYINLTSDGQKLKLKPGRTLSVQFPKLSTKEMSLFYGTRDSLGRMNWKPTAEKFKSISKPRSIEKEQDEISTDYDDIMSYIEGGQNKPLSKEDKRAIAEEAKFEAFSKKLYATAELQQLGWINCDRFYDAENKTSLEYAFDGKDTIVDARVFLVFRDINSAMEDVYFVFRNTRYNSRFENIPIGAKTRLIAITLKNGKAYTYKSDLTIEPNQTLTLPLKETDTKDVATLFSLK